MFKLIRSFAVLSLSVLFVSCNGDNAPGVSAIAGEKGVSYSQNEQPIYYQKALARAAQLSTTPNIVVAMCESDAKARGYNNSKLEGFVYQCVENAGME